MLLEARGEQALGEKTIEHQRHCKIMGDEMPNERIHGWGCSVTRARPLSLQLLEQRIERIRG